MPSQEIRLSELIADLLAMQERLGGPDNNHVFVVTGDNFCGVGSIVRLGKTTRPQVIVTLPSANPTAYGLQLND